MRAVDTLDSQLRHVRIANLRVRAEAQSPILSSLPIRIGRDPSNDLVCKAPSVSNHHLTVEPADGGARVVDSGSTQGTWVSGIRICEAILPLPATVSLGEHAQILIEDPGDALQVVPDHPGFAGLVGDSDAMRALKVHLQSLAKSPWPVLLLGETGTGKEQAARCLHALGPRSEAPFVVVDCSGLPSSIIEGELFGRETGAYSGAERSQPGPFERAQGGTVFLDEVGELEYKVQGKLLRVLAENRVQRLGATSPQSVDVQIIAATNRDLGAEVRARHFREDLFYRFISRLRLPPLRDRTSDIPELVRYFVETARLELGGQAEVPDGLALRLAGRVWPGNVRELRSAVREALLGFESEPVVFGDEPSPAIEAQQWLDLPQGLALEAFEIWYFKTLLARHPNKTNLAKVAGLQRQSLYKAFKRLGLDPS